jgi:hypothetical protein
MVAMKQGDDEDTLPSAPESLREWGRFSAEVAFKILEEVQGRHLVRLKGEPEIEDATMHTTVQKLVKLKVCSRTNIDIDLRDRNFGNSEMISHAERNEFMPTFCLNNDPKMLQLGQWTNKTERQTTTLEEVQKREKEHVAKGIALEVKIRRYGKYFTSADNSHGSWRAYKENSSTVIYTRTECQSNQSKHH